MQRNSIITLFIEAAIFIGIIMFGINYYNNQLDISDQNLKAYKGQLEQVEMKNGELVAIRDSYVLKTKDLQEQFDLSQKEIRDLKRKLGSSLAYIAELESNIKIDTIVTIKDTIIYKDKETDIRFLYQDDWVSFNGLTSLKNNTSSTRIFNMNMDVPLKFGISDDYQIFVQSNNPYVNFTNLEGAVIDGSKLKPKKTRFNWGFQIGFGISYDIFDKDYSIGPYGGIGAEVNF